MKKSEKNLANLFKNVIMMSGTPDWVQQEMTVKNRHNECKCPPKLAMDNGWICKPSLSLINCSESSWPSAIKAVFDREMHIWEISGKIFRPTILVNCKSIDDVANLRNVSWFKDNAGKLFHLISIHSRKLMHDKSGTVLDVSAEIDGKKVEAEEAYNEIVKIDRVEDDMPVIVFQVQMIGEGINVKSFNAVVTASNCDKTAMQQIGRAVRNFSIKKDIIEKHEVKASGFFNRLFNKTKVVDKVVEKTFTKTNDGHANVYVINDNLKTLTNLVVGLSNYDLTSECFSWGDKIDLNEGSSPEILNEAESSQLHDSGWQDIKENDPEIIEVLSSAKKKILTSCFDKFFSGLEDNDENGIPDVEEFREMLVDKHKEGWTEVWTGKKTLGDAEDIMQKFRDMIGSLLEDKTFGKLWDKDRKTALAYAVQDPTMAEFLDTHLNDKTLNSIKL